MALSLGDVKKTKPVRRTKQRVEKTAKPKELSESTEKVRPWQASPSEPADKAKHSQSVSEHISRAAEEAEALFTNAQEQQRAARRQELQSELVDQWLELAEKAKNQGIESLPPQVKEMIKDSWVGKIQLFPKVKIPVPSILHTKNKD